MDVEFLEKQFASLGLSRETVKKMTLREILQFAKEIHGKEPKIVGVPHFPVSEDCHIMTDRIGLF